MEIPTFFPVIGQVTFQVEESEPWQVSARRNCSAPQNGRNETAQTMEVHVGYNGFSARR